MSFVTRRSCLVAVAFALTAAFGSGSNAQTSMQAEPAPAATPMDAPKPKVVAPASPELLAKVKQGGYVMFMRHPPTGKDKDVDMIDLSDCAKQRNLSDEGRATARAIGKAMQTLKIPVGDVLSSQFCRAKEAAELMGFTPTTTLELNLTFDKDNKLIIPQEENDKRVDALRKIVAAGAKSGTNTLLVSHRPTLEAMGKEQDTTGKAFGNIDEGEIVVFEKADAAPGFAYVGRIAASHWAQFEQLAAK